MKNVASEIRSCLEGMPCPICTKSVDDTSMKKLAKDIDTILISRFGTKDTTLPKVNVAWWETLEYLAIGEYDMPYYEDMD